MSTDWCAVRVTFHCLAHIDRAEADGLLLDIMNLVHARYADAVKNVHVDLLEPPDFFGRTGAPQREETDRA